MTSISDTALQQNPAHYNPRRAPSLRRRIAKAFREHPDEPAAPPPRAL